MFNFLQLFNSAGTTKIKNNNATKKIILKKKLEEDDNNDEYYSIDMETASLAVPRAPLLQPQTHPFQLHHPNVRTKADICLSKEEEKRKEFEEACEIATAPQSSAEERKKAEECILKIKNGSEPYKFCMDVLHQTKSSKAQHESALCMKDAFLREWATLDKRMVVMMRTKALEFVCSNSPQLQSYVMKQLLRLVAIMYKRVWFESEKTNSRLMISQIKQMLQNKNPSIVIVGNNK
ncbi:exportin 4-like protein [Reticulomyxa filosa]|uniref:Exportin 4-like protein n=1 Tax=Reticulomyxa filosa TaxID=46433 RepID=X6P809_RETFI|nr:exportin 4-like protein [Reticulomyxa filosa]|eukprot:ETO33767.1 exportin 4-like protein [Reticulomyxa filosa]